MQRHETRRDVATRGSDLSGYLSYFVRLRPLVVHLMRHGEVENPAALHYGRLPGFSLSAVGERHVELCARWLARRAVPARLVTSPLLRARQSAAILARALGAEPATVDDRLLEAGSFRDGLPRAGAPWAQVERLLDARARAQSESSRSVVARMVEVITGCFLDPSCDVVLVSHQTPIRAARTAFERSWWSGLVGPARCAPASLTSLTFELGWNGPRWRRTDYFEPART